MLVESENFLKFFLRAVLLRRFAPLFCLLFLAHRFASLFVRFFLRVALPRRFAPLFARRGFKTEKGRGKRGRH